MADPVMFYLHSGETNEDKPPAEGIGDSGNAREAQRTETDKMEQTTAGRPNDSGVMTNGGNYVRRGSSASILFNPAGHEDPVVSIVVKEDDQPAKKDKKKYEGFDRVAVLSVMYALTLTVLGLVFPTTEALKSTWFTNHAVGAYMVYLFTVSIVFLLYLQFFVLPRSKKWEASHHHAPKVEVEPPAEPKPGDVVLRRRRSSLLTDLPDAAQLESMGNSSGGVFDTQNVGMTSSPSSASIGSRRFSVTEGEAMEYIHLTTHTASQAHEGTSIFLRLGALAFAIGNVIYVSLQLEFYLGGYISTDCPNYRLIYPMIFHLVFILVQTFFVLKNPMIHVSIHKPVVRLGLMHVIATNMCVWWRVMIEETKHGAHAHSSEPHVAGPQSVLLGSLTNPDVILQAGPADSDNCSDANSLMNQTSPYIFPLVLEYSLTVLAVLYGMAAGVVAYVPSDIIKTVKETLKRRKKAETFMTSAQSEASSDHGDHEHSKEDFAKAHMGLFCGIIFLAGVVVSMVLFGHYQNNDVTTAQKTYQITNLITQSMLVLAVIGAAYKIFKLSYSWQRENTVDDLLLVISTLAILIFQAFLAIAEIDYIEQGGGYGIPTKSLASAIITMVQALVQTLYIMDGLHRSSSSEEQRKSKPGRGFITFLIIANVAMWAFKTFQVKNTGLDRQDAFYGNVAWNLILHINLPLMLFYRFHSAVCLADMWEHCYADH